MNRLIQKAPVILASKSPRRKELLLQAGLQFEVIPSRVDESTVAPAAPESYAAALSQAKADDVGTRFPARWVIAADTIVRIDREILGKPRDRAEARDMLQRLSGRTHQVYTAFTICRLDRDLRHTQVIGTDVTFKALSAEEIEWYIRTAEPFDKAGAYAIQGLGTALVRRIDGSYTNVVGLPVCEVMDYLIGQRVLEIPEFVN